MSQKPRLERQHLCCAVITLATLAGPLCYAKEKAPLPLEDPNTVIAEVIAALKQIEHPATGRGKASMMINDLDTENKERHFEVDFVFKGANSCADIRARNESGVLTRWYAEVNSARQIICVHEWGAKIKSPEAHEPRIGFDFSPEMFVQCFGIPVVEHLELALEHPHVPRSLELNDQGILHVTTSSKKRTADGEPRSKTKLSFDIGKGFRPTHYEWRTTRPDGSWNVDMTTLEWSQYDGHWYVSRGEIKTLPRSAVHRAFTVKRFKPNVKVSDRKFTLEGLDLAYGFPVSDAIEGITYRYGDKKEAKPIIRRAKPNPKQQ